MGWILMQTIFSLIAVLALIIIVVYLMKRWVFGGQSNPRSAVPIDVLGHRMLQPKNSIYVVRVLGKMLVVGLSEGGMHTLTEMDDEPAESQSNAADEFIQLKRKTQPAFMQYLKESIGIVKPKSGVKISHPRNGSNR